MQYELNNLILNHKLREIITVTNQPIKILNFKCQQVNIGNLSKMPIF